MRIAIVASLVVVSGCQLTAVPPTGEGEAEGGGEGEGEGGGAEGEGEGEGDAGGGEGEGDALSNDLVICTCNDGSTVNSCESLSCDTGAQERVCDERCAELGGANASACLSGYIDCAMKEREVDRGLGSLTCVCGVNGDLAVARCVDLSCADDIALAGDICGDACDTFGFNDLVCSDADRGCASPQALPDGETQRCCQCLDGARHSVCTVETGFDAPGAEATCATACGSVDNIDFVGCLAPGDCSGPPDHLVCACNDGSRLTLCGDVDDCTSSVAVEAGCFGACADHDGVDAAATTCADDDPRCVP